MSVVRLTDSFLSGNEMANVAKCFEENWLTRGRFVDEFERKFCELLGVKHGFANCNGTTAITLALAGCGVTGGRVLVPNYTCVATPNAVVHAGARVTLVEVERETFGMDFEAAKKEIEAGGVTAIVLVHIYGHPARDTMKLRKMCDQTGVILIEDCAEAHGASIGVLRSNATSATDMDSVMVGAVGDASSFSFRGDKMIGVGEGGMTLTNDPEVYHRIKKLGDLGRPDDKRRYYHDEIAWQYNMGNVMGAIGSAQVDILPEVVKRKRQVADWYAVRLADLVNRKLVTVQKPIAGNKPVYWLNALLFERPIDRPKFLAELSEKKIEVRPFFEPMASLPIYRNQWQAGKFSVSEEIARKGVLLPSSPHMLESQADQVCEVIRKYATI